MTQAQQSPDQTPVPALRIVAGAQAARDGDGGSAGPPFGFRPLAGLASLILALAVATALAVAFVLVQDSHPAAGRSAARAASQEQLRGRSYRPLLPIRIGPTSAVAAGVRLTVIGSSAPGSSAPRRSHAAAAHSRSRADRPAVSSAHELSISELVDLADGRASYQPPAYLARAYRGVAARYRVPWRLLAAVEYIQGGDADAFAGPLAGPEEELARTVGESFRAINQHVLARAVAAAARPSLHLLADARHLAADGAAQSAARAVSLYMGDAQNPAQAVLTLAQEIGEPKRPSAGAETPLGQVDKMQSEARLLNGIPYSWGGGHQSPAWVVSSGYDCSGFVSAVLHSAGYLSSPETTQTLPGVDGILKGPGKYVSIYDRTVATVKILVKKKKIFTVRKAVNPATVGVHLDKGTRANSPSIVSIRLPRWVGQWKTIKLTKLVPSLDNSNNDEHVIIDLDGQWWESGGSTADGGAAMVHRIVDPSASYLASFNMILHPSGL